MRVISKTQEKHDSIKIKNATILFLIVLISFHIVSCNGKDSTKKLRHFVPDIDTKGNVKVSNKGDTIWHKIPKFSFLDENGETLTEKYMDGNIVVVDFFFATCPSICIPMSNNLSKIQNHFKNTSNVKILSHTVNPKHDTPEVLNAYAKSYNADSNKWKFVTGDKKALYKQARKGYYITAIDGNGGKNDFIHSEKFVLLDKNRNIRGFFRGTIDEDIDALIASIKTLLKE